MEMAYVQHAQRFFADDDIAQTIAVLIQGLGWQRATSSDWKRDIRALRDTEIYKAAHICPMTRHAFDKPRGYAGDALLLDWIYRDFRVLKAPTPLSLAARALATTTQHPSSVAVRLRCKHLAATIDEVAAKIKKPRILALAAGHLREADHSTALKAGAVGELVAFDQDAQSLHEVERCYVNAGRCVTIARGNIGDVIAGRLQLSDFDLIYSAGLYDYLEDPVARKLSARLFDALNPGGTLLLTNFLEGVSVRGWMEAMMDAWLIYRTPEQIAQFAALIPSEQIADRVSYLCPTVNVGYLRLIKSTKAQ